ncbi:MAG TPA: class I SAM-dependent methyltransferase [Gemmataceae bacterium]|jgi:SAM-dependent methyltransferase|nr:class I SAM-dependent methyltransferase [Gemmataceae bacterium]
MNRSLHKSPLVSVLESKQPSRQPLAEYKDFVRDHYDGPAGAFTAVTGILTGHDVLAGQLIRPGGFDVRGCKHILDAGCGNGRYSIHLLKNADPDATLDAFDLSQGMLTRARKRLDGDRVSFVAADLTRLPYADSSFDAVVCGWVLEHLPDPRPGLRELSRILQPGGKLLLMCTEDTFLGAWCSRLWHCRTYNRRELRRTCAECGLVWERELWFSPVHRRLRLGGILAELIRV